MSSEKNMTKASIPHFLQKKKKKKSQDQLREHQLELLAQQLAQLRSSATRTTSQSVTLYKPETLNRRVN